MSERSLFLEAIGALAQIDHALGLPDDGCNSPQLTIAAIKSLRTANERLGTLLQRAVGQIEGYKRAGWLVTPSAGEEANDILDCARRALAQETGR